jgi:7,8-dihydro-6-hydroxymethylpterin dimethyltransferase
VSVAKPMVFVAAAPAVHAEVVGQAAAEVVGEDQAAGLAARDRLALPDLRPRGAAGDPRRQEGRGDPADEKVGEIKAQIIERDGKILMVKDCPKHGHFEDVMAIDPAFFKHLEEVFPGRDIRAHNDEKLHNHGSSTIKYGRGSVLTVDLTNRCNMMCDPCFMDANQVGFVHELTWEDIKTMLDNAISIKPRRQMSVQFSGGEPTLSPYFLDAVRYARKVGYNSVQAATNGIEFAKSPGVRRQAAEAGLRYAYLQFDGIGNAANSHRRVGNLFDVKLKAIENLHAAGVDIVPVITIVNGVNNEQVGRIIEFALDNPARSASCLPAGVLHRPRRGGHDERRAAQRYTLSHLAHDVKNQTGLGEPTRDWFPISFMGTFSDWADLVTGPSRVGPASCGCHPNCGVGMAVMIDKETKEAGAGDRVPERRPAGEGHGARSTTRRAASSCRSSAWRWR